VGTLFSLIRLYADQWQAIRSVQPAPLVGTLDVPQGEPENVPVHIPAMIAKLRDGLPGHSDMLRQVLAAEQYAAIVDIAARSEASFTFPAETWASVVFDFAVAYNYEVLFPEQVMAAMVPLYYGRTAGLIKEARDMNSAEFEQQVVQAQATVFERLKPELVRRWAEARTG